MEVLTIDKTIWLKIMKTVRETKEGLQTRDYERLGKRSTPVVEIKGVRETNASTEEANASMEELD
jgi:hypothetical protein